jgi:hypothetical protein
MKPLNRKNYGSIPHLLGSKLGATDKYVDKGQHRIMTEKTRDKHDYVIVTEKYDGSNVGIAKVNGKIVAITRSGYLAKTSPYSQHHYFAKWVEVQGNRFDFIGEKERIVGEWMMCAHGIKYDILKEPFVAFDYFTPDNERLLHSDLISKTINAEIETPRIIFHGYQAFRLDWALEELNGNKHRQNIVAQENPEGLVYRVERKGKFDYAAKFVRQDHQSGKYIINITEENLTWNVKPSDLF